MDTFAGLAFSYEPALEEYMEEPPKKRDEKNKTTLDGNVDTDAAGIAIV